LLREREGGLRGHGAGVGKGEFYLFRKEALRNGKKEEILLSSENLRKERKK